MPVRSLRLAIAFLALLLPACGAPDSPRDGSAPDAPSRDATAAPDGLAPDAALDAPSDAPANPDVPASPDAGPPVRLPLAGDWNRASVSRPGLYDSRGHYYLRDTNAPNGSGWETRDAPTDPGTTPLAGDWYGEGISRTGYRDRGGVFHLEPRAEPIPPVSCATTACPAGSTCDAARVCVPGWVTFAFGAPGAVPVVGDWDGDGVDTVGVFDAGEWQLRNSNSAGDPDVRVTFGRAGDVPVVGDWNGNGAATPGVFRAPNHWLLREYFTGYASADDANHVFDFGAAGDLPVAGDWDGDGHAGVGVLHADGGWSLRNATSAGAADFAYAWDPTAPDAPWSTRGVVVTEGTSHRVLLLDPAVSDWNASAALLWSWAAADSLPSADQPAFANATDARLVYFGKLMVVSCNYGGSNPLGGVAVIRVSDEAALFHATGNYNFHSVEYLPDGNVAAVASTEGLLRVYDTADATGATHADYPFVDAHGVVWDPAHLVLWVFGSDASNAAFPGLGRLVAYRYGGTRARPTLTALATYAAPSAPIAGRWGHDLQPVPGTSELFVTTNLGNYRFDTHTATWTTLDAPEQHAFVKAMSQRPDTGQVLEVVTDGTDSASDTLTFFAPAATRRRTGAQFYKARFWYPTPQRFTAW